jgi:hypothetical protein
VRSTIAVVAAAAATSFVSRGSAAAPPEDEPVHLEYRAPATCQDDARFFARARSRAPRMRIARSGERARMFLVEIEQQASRTSGRLTIRDPEGRKTVREIEAKDCDEAVDALALIVALAVNPRAGAPEAPSTVSEETEPVLAAPAQEASAPVAPARVPTPGLAATPLTPASARTAPLWTFRAGLAGFGIGAIAPAPLLGVRLSGEIKKKPARV